MDEKRIVPRSNVSPTQQVPIIFDERPDVLTTARWGLVPFCAKYSRMVTKLLPQLPSPRTSALLVSQPPLFKGKIVFPLLRERLTTSGGDALAA